MARHRSPEKLEKIALTLMGQQLDVLSAKQGQLAHEESLTVCRFFSALQSRKKLEVKDENEERKKLKKMSTADLRRKVLEDLKAK